MAKIDLSIKRLMQLRLQDWIKLIVPNVKKMEIVEMDKEKLPKVKSSMDKLVWIDDGKERKIINIEPQGYKDAAFSARMLRYRADIWEYTLTNGLGNPSIIQTAVYFFKKDIQEQLAFNDVFDENCLIQYKYSMIKIWNLSKSFIIKNKLIGLYPLLPLMKKEPTETDEDIIELTIDTINEVENEPLRADLLSVMSIISLEEYASELIKKYVRREMLMKSTLYQEWVEEERKEAAAKAIKDTTINQMKKVILELLITKFDYIPQNIWENLNSINDEKTLEILFRKTIKIEFIEDFEKLLEKNINND